MLNAIELDKQKGKIINLLEGTKREGMPDLIDDLIKNGFFEAPASTRFHGCDVGGLAKHSLGVFDKLMELNHKVNLSKPTAYGQKPLEFTRENLLIAALLHDICKAGAYVRTKADDGWTNNKKKDKGHAILSIDRIKEHIKLDPIEEMMIRYHMGVYHVIEYDDKAGEYHLLSQTPDAPKEERYGKSYRNALYHNPIVKLISIADELATMEEKALEV